LILKNILKIIFKMDILKSKEFHKVLENEMIIDLSDNRNTIFIHIVLYIALINKNLIIEKRNKNIQSQLQIGNFIIIINTPDFIDDICNPDLLIKHKQFRIVTNARFTFLKDGIENNNKTEQGELVFNEFMKVSFLNRQQEFQLYDIFKRAGMLKTDFILKLF
jgi:hypothetical protein